MVHCKRLVGLVCLLLLAPLSVAAIETPGQVYFDLGVFAFQEEAWQEAAARFKQALESQPANPNYNYYLGKTYFQMKDYHAAEAYFERARRGQPGLPALAYDLARIRYHLGKYKEAAWLFEEVLDKEPDHVLARYYAGLSLYQMKAYSAAVTQLSQVAEKNASLRANCFYYMGLSNVHLKNAAAARADFDKAAALTDSPDMKANVSRWVAALEQQKPEPRPLGIYFKLGGQYDDNVQLEPLDQDLFSDQDDMALVASLGARYDILRKPKYRVGLGYSHFQTWYSDLREFNQIASTPSLFAAYQRRRLKLDFTYMPGFYWVNGDRFLMRHQLQPGVSLQIKDALSTRIAYTFTDNNYHDAPGRDGQLHDVTGHLYYRAFKKKGVLFAGLGYAKNEAAQPDYEYDRFLAECGLRIMLPWQITLLVVADYQDREYRHVDSIYGVCRDDIKLHGGLSLEKKVFREWLRVVLDYDHFNNDSNIDRFTYRRNVATLSLAMVY